MTRTSLAPEHAQRMNRTQPRLPRPFLTGACLSLTWTFLYRTLEVATASYMTQMSIVTHVVVSLLTVAFLGETLVPIQLLGAALILLSGAVTYLSGVARA